MKVSVKKKMILYFVFAVFILRCNNPEVDLTIASVFSDKMVLQQAQSNSVWGEAKPNSIITITTSWGENLTTQTDDNGRWIFKLPTPSYVEGSQKEKHSIQVTDGQTKIIIQDVLFGEVWLASGQSNMEWRMNQCDSCVTNQIEEIEKSTNNYIRMFSVPQDLNDDSIKYTKWKSASPENTGSFSATAYYFAKKLYDKLGVPIGIINSSWGGTRIESWISPSKIVSLDETKNFVPDDYGFIKYRNYLRKKDDSITNNLAKKYGFTPLHLPKFVESGEKWNQFNKEWEELNLLDKSFSKVEFDDSLWDKLIPKSNKYGGLKCDGRFEAIFDESDPLLSNGIIWFRTSVEINDISKDYVLQIEKGIDDGDQTFFNGKLIGNTFGWSLERKYIIPKSIIKKGINIIAFRVTDPGGGGGFNSPVKLYNDDYLIELPFNKFKFKHHGFTLNELNILIHNYSYSQLFNIDEEIRKDILMRKPVAEQNQFSAMYECMLSNIIPYGIKGFIWYQGESNVSNHHEYSNLFSGMIDDWRSAWGSDLPFYFAQIAPFEYDKELNSESLRESQRKVLGKVKKTGMAILLDIGEKEDIHPENKKDVGERLSLHALKNQYNIKIEASGPLYKTHNINGSQIEVEFDHFSNGLFANGKLTGFEVAGDDGVFYPAKASILSNKIVVFSKEVAKPIHVRYGWQNWFIGNLFNSDSLPASSFSSL